MSYPRLAAGLPRRVLAVVALIAVASPAAAQAPAEARSHTVRPGDTLWDIARSYLSDSFLWTEIYRLNAAVIDDPKALRAGVVLALPAGAAGATLATNVSTPEPEAELPAGSTVFARSLRTTAAIRYTGVVGENERRAVRIGQHHAAPWLDRRGGPQAQGRLVGAAKASGIAEHAIAERSHTQGYVYITVPEGTAPQVGSRYLIFRLGSEMPDHAQLVIPTGIVEVRASEIGEAATAQVVSQFDEIIAGQGVLALEPFESPMGVHAAPVQLGPISEVIAVPSGAVLPSLQRYVVLNTGSADGVRIGDQFTLFRPRVRQHDGVVLPELAIARVQAVRVTDRGTTAIIISQAEPAISVGTSARLTARMP